MKGPIAEIARIRVKNNDLWMRILEIALRHAPAETKEVLAHIKANDTDISDLLGEIVNEDRN